MFCIALVLLLQCLFGSCGYTFKVGAPEFVQLDLFDGLHLHNSSYTGIELGKGYHTLSPGVNFSGDFRDIIISGEWVERIRDNIAEIGADGFTISAFVKQNPNNVGTLLAFSRGLFSALEIQSSGRKNELRVISGSTVETFPFRLADGSWHRLVISFSATQVDILVNCSLLYRRVLKFDPVATIFDSQNISVCIGQKNPSHFLYKGVMQDLRLTFGPYGYLSQCPQVDTQCPTCSDYTAFKKFTASMEARFTTQIQMLTERLNRQEALLLKQSECQKSCRLNETSVFEDGSSWQQDCNLCTCKRGEIVCQPIQCPQLNCKNPVSKPGECCATCLKQCFYKTRTYDHGEVLVRPTKHGCGECECIDGSMACKTSDFDQKCPPLSCPLSEQIVVPEKCCKVCPGTDYCAAGHECHPNATCLSLQTQSTCTCKAGFSGDGKKSCDDLDECLLGKSQCDHNSVCVNQIGGYDCECIKGFRKNSLLQCQDIDECADGSHKCHPHATCTNTKGSYVCTCKEKYTGNGFQCSPICNRTCENGGLCIAPDVCSCRSGWIGAQCETDVNECLNEGNSSSKQTGTLCPENALCVNKPGWHFCECKEGFQAFLSPHGIAQCQVNECEENICPEDSVCFNTIGSYECRCPEGAHYCSQGCFEDGIMHQPGSKWLSEDCHICSCTSPGTTSCQADSSDACSQLCPPNAVNVHKCCTNCGNMTTLPINNNNKNKENPKKCRHQIYPEIQFQSGEIWHSHCQTCECLDGEIDCWPIDCPPVDCHNAFLPAGDCCFRCPGETSNDKCTHFHRNSTFTECHLLQNTIESGTRVTLPHSHCISCKCQVPLCAKSVSKNDGFCVLRTENSAVVTIMIVWLMNLIQLS